MILTSGLYLSPSVSQWPNVMTDVGTSTIYATPDVFNGVPFFDGTSWAMAEPGQMQLLLTTTAHLQGNLYNIASFRDPDNGLPMLGTSPAWMSTTSAGTSAEFFSHPTNWLPVNQATMVMRNGSRTISVPANEAFWLGTMFASSDGIVYIDSTNGPGPRHMGLWNRWNRKRKRISVSDPGPTSHPDREFNYNSRHPDFVNDNPNNHFLVVTGMPSLVTATLHMVVYGESGAMVEIAIQLDDETFSTGQLPQTFPGQTMPGALKHSGNITSSGRDDAHTVKAEATKLGAMGTTKAASIWWIESFAGNNPGATEPGPPEQRALGWGSVHSHELVGWLDA